MPVRNAEMYAEAGGYVSMCFRYLCFLDCAVNRDIEQGSWGAIAAYIAPFVHWTSSTMSKLAWTMNWFM